ncbi:MAG: SDR family NAD(P)-dependent oxidoreductase [Bacteriovoracaceae bacterium]
MNIFITGGASGMGAELAKIYLLQGCRVGICGRDSGKYITALTEVFHSLDPKMLSRLEFFVADISNRTELELAVKSFLNGQKLDIFIANAGIPTGKKSSMPDFDKARDLININVLGTLNSFDVAFQEMKNSGGQIVAVASVAGMNGLPGVAPYSGSKAAVIKMCESYALDWKRFGITVSCLCPGFVDTAFTKINNHSMPFLMSAARAGQLMKSAIDGKKKFYVFPLRMYLICFILSVIPRYFYRMIMSLKIFNYSS